MREYQSNSHLSKERQKEQTEVVGEKKIQKVVSGTVKTKENKGRKLTDIFVPGDVSNVKSYVFMDVFVPAVKDLVYKILVDSADMILFGGSSASKSKSSSKPSYRSYYENKSDRRDSRPATKSRIDYDDIIYPTRRDAEAVLDEMSDAIDKYQLVTVLDMYDAAGLGGEAPYTADKFGWTNLRNAEVKRVRDGYIIDLPKPAAFEL